MFCFCSALRTEGGKAPPEPSGAPSIYISTSCWATHGATTHTFEDVDFELVEDLPYGLHVRLQVLGVLRHSIQCRRQNRAQIESQDAVHGVAGKRGLRGNESVVMVSVWQLLSLRASSVHFVRFTFEKRQRWRHCAESLWWDLLWKIPRRSGPGAPCPGHRLLPADRRGLCSVCSAGRHRVKHDLETDCATARAVRFSPNDAAQECTLHFYSHRSLGCMNSFLWVSLAGHGSCPRNGSSRCCTWDCTKPCRRRTREPGRTGGDS